MKNRAATTTAAMILALEALALLALAGFQVVAMFEGDTANLATAIALMVLTIILAVGVAAFAVGTMKGLTWARSGGVVTQLLILSVALGAATGQYAHPLAGAAIAVPAVFGLFALFRGTKALAVAEEAQRREEERQAADRAGDDLTNGGNER